MTTVLAGGRVITTMAPPRMVEAEVVVEHGRVVAVGRGPEGAPRRDCGGCLVIPGNVVAHTHLYSSLARGMPFHLDTPRNFVEILQRVWWRLDRGLDEASIRASALLGGMEALLAGSTTLFDHHASPNEIDGSLDVVADALEFLGLRGVLCYEVTDRDGTRRAQAGIEENRRFLGRRRHLMRGMVGMHASFSVSPETMDGCVEAAREADAGIHIHVAEDESDQRDSEARYGTRVVHRLADADVLRHDSLLAHAVHLDRSEVELVRHSGAAVAHNPRSNMHNGVGRAPVADLGSRVALGTDGMDGDMFAESHAAYLRRREEEVSVAPTWALRRLGEGGHVAGLVFGEPLLGHIEPGAPADLVVLEYAEPTPLDEDNLASHWMFGLGDARRVRDVMVNGDWVVLDRRLTRVDQERLVAEAAGVAVAMWERMDDIRPHSFAPKGWP